MTHWIEDGYHSITPYLIVSDAEAAIEFYKKAFDASEVMRLPMGDKIGHANIMIGNSNIMLADEFPDLNKLGPNSRGGGTTSLMLYVPDCDAIIAKAIAAGATILNPIENQFYGDRNGSVIDPFGHEWTISTHIEDVSPEEMNKRFVEMMETE